jgi:hypothetical protein
MTVEEQLNRLTGIVGTLTTAIEVHGQQIEGLITVAEKHSQQLAELERKLQANIDALPNP